MGLCPGGKRPSDLVSQNLAPPQFQKARCLCLLHNVQPRSTQPNRDILFLYDMAGFIVRRLLLLLQIGVCLFVDSSASPVTRNSLESRTGVINALDALFHNSEIHDREDLGLLDCGVRDEILVTHRLFHSLDEFVLRYHDMNSHATVIVIITGRGPVLAQVPFDHMLGAEHDNSYEAYKQLDGVLFGNGVYEGMLWKPIADMKGGTDKTLEHIPLPIGYAAIFTPSTSRGNANRGSPIEFPVTVQRLRSRLEILFELAGGKGAYTKDQVFVQPTPYRPQDDTALSAESLKRAYAIHWVGVDDQGYLDFFAGPISTTKPTISSALHFDQAKKIWTT